MIILSGVCVNTNNIYKNLNDSQNLLIFKSINLTAITTKTIATTTEKNLKIETVTINTIKYVNPGNFCGNLLK